MAFTTAEDVQRELQSETAFSSSTYPSLDSVESWIKQVEDGINDKTNNKYTSSQYVDVIDYDGACEIPTKYAPIISVASVLASTAALGTASYALSDTKVEDTDFTIYKSRGLIVPLMSNWTPKEGRKMIQITYTAGSSVTPPRIKGLATKQVALRVLNTLLSRDMNDGNVGGSVSVGSISIVEPSEYGVGRYKTLKEDVNELKRDLISKGTKAVRFNNYYKD